MLRYLLILALVFVSVDAYAKFGTNNTNFGNDKFGKREFNKGIFSQGKMISGGGTTPEGALQYLGDDLTYQGDTLTYNP